MTKHELLLHAAAHEKAAKQVKDRLAAELLAEAPRTGPYIETGREKIVVVSVEPKLTQDEQDRLLGQIAERLPGARHLFIGARINRDTLAAARGSRNPDEAEAARLCDEMLDAKRDERAAGGRNRTVQVTVSPERIAAHLESIEEAMALAAAESVGAAEQVAPRRPEPVEPPRQAMAQRQSPAHPVAAAPSFMDGFE